MEKICIICKKPFTPAPRHNSVQRTCSPECRRIYNNERSLARQHDPENKARRKKQYYDTHKTYCQLCGKVVEHPIYATNNAPTARMHDECVYEDCRRSLLCGSRIGHVQQLRLAYRGYRVKDFIAESTEWRDKHMPMSACDERAFHYVPQQFWLAVDRIVQNPETGMIELDLRTGFKNNEFVIEHVQFARLKDIRPYFMKLKEK